MGWGDFGRRGESPRLRLVLELLPQSLAIDSQDLRGARPVPIDTGQNVADILSFYFRQAAVEPAPAQRREAHERWQKSDYDYWAELGNRGWSWNDVLPYFKRTEDYAHGAVMRLDLEGARPAISNINDPRILPRPLQHALAARSHVFDIADRIVLLDRGEKVFDKKTTDTTIEEVSHLIAKETVRAHSRG